MVCRGGKHTHTHTLLVIEPRPSFLWADDQTEVSECGVQVILLPKLPPHIRQLFEVALVIAERMDPDAFFWPGNTVLL